MAQRTRNIAFDREVSVRFYADTGNRGNGADKHIPIGKTIIGVDEPRTFRGFMRPAFDWTGVRRILAARLWLRVSGAAHIDPMSGSGTTLVQKVTEEWTVRVGSSGEGVWATDTSTVYPGPATTAVNEASLTHAATEATWFSWDIRAIVEEWAPDSVLKFDGTPGEGEDIYGLRIKALDETTVGDSVEYHGLRQTANLRPYIELVYDDNLPPFAPTDVTPGTSGTDPTIHASAGANEVRVEGTFSDPDASDTMKWVNAQVFPATATDAAPGAPLQESTRDGTGSPPNLTGTGIRVGGRFFLYVYGLQPRTSYRLRVRTADASGATGPFTALSDGLFQTAYGLGAPGNLTWERGTIENPTIGATLVSPDATDYITASDIEVMYDPPAGGSVVLWAEGLTQQGGTATRLERDYSGTQLLIGQRIRFRLRLANRDGELSPWSAWTYVDIDAFSGARLTPGDPSTQIQTRTPSITITETSNFDGVRYRIYRSIDGALIYDSGQITGLSSGLTEVITLPADVLNWGDRPGIEVMVHPTAGSWPTEYGTRHELQINSLPAAPIVTITDGEGTTVDAAPDPPVISNVAAGSIDADSAVITWNTNPNANGQVEYGIGTGYGGVSTFQPAYAPAHSHTIEGLQAATLYHYRVRSTTPEGGTAISADFTFLTTGSSPTAPVISSVAVADITATSARITWTTNLPATSVVRYGLTTGYGSTASDPTFKTSHQIILTGLQSGPTYNYQVESVTADGGKDTEANATFATTSTVPVMGTPVVTAGSLQANSVRMTYTSDIATTGLIEYGPTTAYGQVIHDSDGLITAHEQDISGLAAGTLYHARAKGTTAAGAVGYSADMTFTTPTVVAVAAGIYGSGISASSKSDRTIGPGRNMERLSFRFKSHGGSMTSFVVQYRVGASGYSGGNYGRFRYRLYPCDHTAAHRPDESAAPLREFTIDVLTAIGQQADNSFMRRHTWSSAVTLTADTHYHLVVDNVDPNSATNYASLNCLHNGRVFVPRQPRFADVDFACLGLGSSYPSTFTDDPDHTPILDVTYADTTHDGQGYLRSSPSMWGTAGGTTRIRERITVTGGSKVITELWWRLIRLSGTGAPTLRLESGATTTGAGALVEEGVGVVQGGTSIPTGTLNGDPGLWVRYVLSTPRTLTNGSTYAIVVHAPSGTSFGSRMVGAADSSGASSDMPNSSLQFPDGTPQESTDSGTTWGVVESSTWDPHNDFPMYAKLQ
jgi:hypothetical protein